MRRYTGFPLIFISYTVISHMEKEVYWRRGHSHEGSQEGERPTQFQADTGVSVCRYKRLFSS